MLKIIGLPPTQCSECNATVTTLYLNRELAVGVEHSSLRFRIHLLKPLFHHLRESTGPRIITSSHKLQHWYIKTMNSQNYRTILLQDATKLCCCCLCIFGIIIIILALMYINSDLTPVLSFLSWCGFTRFILFCYFSNLAFTKIAQGTITVGTKSQADLWLTFLLLSWLNTCWPVFSWKLVAGLDLHGATGRGRAVTMGRYCRRSAISLSRP